MLAWRQAIDHIGYYLVVAPRAAAYRPHRKYGGHVSVWSVVLPVCVQHIH